MAKPRIVCNPKIMVGKPTIEGTRLTVELILEKLAEGHPVEELLYAYPRLTREGIQAALEYAADIFRAGQTVSVFRKAA